jgi:hypothetical protein
MRIICEVCKQEGYLQQLGSNYFRVRHYAGKGKFYYHQQNKEYALNQLNSRVSTNDQLNTKCDQPQALCVQKSISDGCNILKLSLDNGNTRNIVCGRRLVWFRTLAFQANDPGFKSRRPHHPQLLTQKNSLIWDYFVCD